MHNSSNNPGYNSSNESATTDGRCVRLAAVTPDTVENEVCIGFELPFKDTQPIASSKPDGNKGFHDGKTDTTQLSSKKHIDKQYGSIDHGNGQVRETHPRINTVIQTDMAVYSPLELQESTTSSTANTNQNNGNNSEKGVPEYTRGNHLREVLVLSFAFQLAFTSYGSVQNLQSSLHSADGLGVISLSCLYGSIIVAGFVTPIVIRILGAKLSLIVAWFCHCVYIGANFYPTWATLIPASVILGLISAPLWTSHSLYITQHALAQSAETGNPSHKILSKYFGISFTLYGTTHIVGNLIASLVLHSQNSNTNGHLANTSLTYYSEPYGNATYPEIIPNTLQFCGVNDCPGDTNSTAMIQDPKSATVYILLGIFLAIDILALLLTMAFLRPLKNGSNEASKLFHSLTSCCLLNFTDRKMLLLVPLILSHAMEQGVLFADFTKSYISCSVGISMVGFVMTAYGIAFTVSSFLVNQIAHWTGRQVLFVAAMTINMTTFVVMSLWNPPGYSGLWVLIAIAIGSGLAEGIWQTQWNALFAMLFEEAQLPQAYANMHTWRAVGFTVVFAYSSFLCTGIKLYVAMAVLSSGALCYTLVELIVWKGHRGGMHVEKTNK